MKKQIKEQLHTFAEKIAKDYSNLEREKNYGNEVFTVSNIEILSETTAAIIFLKSSGKKCFALCWYVNSGNGYFLYFFPTDSHLYGFQSDKIRNIKDDIENWNFNFIKDRGDK